MKSTHPCIVLFLLLSSCALEALLPGSGGGDGDKNGNGFGYETEGPSGSGKRVCVYRSTSEYFCADGYSNFDGSVECETSSSIDACLSAHQPSGSCSGSCCLEVSYYGHTMFDGPCEVALAHANSAGTGSAALIEDRCGVTVGNPSCDDCMNERCANECTSCANEPGCLLVIDCSYGCETESCIKTCIDFYARGYEALLGLDGCLTAHCPDACGG